MCDSSGAGVHQGVRRRFRRENLKVYGYVWFMYFVQVANNAGSMIVVEPWS